MPLIKNVEKRIYDIEGFEVIIKYNGKDVRGDASLPTQYFPKICLKSHKAWQIAKN